METQTEHVMRTVASQTRDDLERLAERMSERSGIAHHVYRDRNGNAKVYPATYEASMGLARI